MAATPTPRTVRARIPWSVVGVVTAAAALCAAVAWTAFVPFGGVELAVEQGGTRQEVGLPAVLATSVIAAAAGGALLRWWQGRSPRATRHWTVLALLVTLLSLLGPSGAVTAAAASSLLALHGVVAAVVIVGLRRASALHAPVA
ncbi:hypothetical protein KUV85_16785 [Nocardioides panacisoli]|uniref:DUF6069 family protein n=1 Tax=Nocardioides panacisoli TaxID=627624 RepID=UPI001C634A88|nr:DUF6069 family protein [Nocardioides panacisoli]QYJ03955.1 hypothetical protein KUV85_16785 [Nocardioides panacisoli]